MSRPPGESATDAPFTVTRDRDTGVAEVRLVGTGRGNAMGARVWSALPDIVHDLDADEEVRTVVLRGSGDCFSVGLDMRWYIVHYRRLMRSGGDMVRRRQALLAEAENMQQAITAITASRLPFLAAVHGACVGAGLDLVSACDIRLASADAYFSLREVRIGIVADLGSLQRLPRLIGAGPTREMALTGRDLPASEAYQRGLVSAVEPDAEGLWRRVHELAVMIAGYPPHVVSGIKDVLEQTATQSLADSLHYAAVWNAAFLPSDTLQDLLAAAIEGTAQPPASRDPAATGHDAPSGIA